MRAWSDESDLAAMVVTRGGHAAGWINLKHVHGSQTRIVWMWVRYAAHCRPPIDMLYAEDLAGLSAHGDQQAMEA